MRAGWRVRLADPMVGAVLALGITQITAWGTSYYCLGVLAGPISRDTGWSRGFVFLGFTVALLVMGLVSNAVGRAIDRHGARAVMTLGTVLVSAGLFALPRSAAKPAYLAVWAFLGVGMRLCLYDAAFAALVQVAPSRGRTAISYLTLFGAFASSVFWVVGHALNERYGWRQTLVLFAAHQPRGLPAAALVRAGAARDAPRTRRHARRRASPDGPPLEGRARVDRHRALRPHHVAQRLRLRRHLGAARPAARGRGAGDRGGGLGRLAEGRGAVRRASGRDRLRAQLAGDDRGRIAIGVLPPVAAPAAGRHRRACRWSSPSRCCMGASQGVITIVRGAVPLALFGAQGYGAVLGVIATPVLVVNAVSPDRVRLDRGPLGLEAGALSLLVGCSAGLARHGADVALVRAPPSWRRRGPTGHVPHSSSAASR